MFVLLNETLLALVPGPSHSGPWGFNGPANYLFFSMTTMAEHTLQAGKQSASLSLSPCLSLSPKKPNHPRTLLQCMKS
uniref:Putative secreted protein n=1 Tax=Anopheles darlingi TaxID=43151 RepID=A0A2M4D416_ANODA